MRSVADRRQAWKDRVHPKKLRVSRYVLNAKTRNVALALARNFYLDSPVFARLTGRSTSTLGDRAETCPVPCPGKDSDAGCWCGVE